MKYITSGINNIIRNNSKNLDYLYKLYIYFDIQKQKYLNY